MKIQILSGDGKVTYEAQVADMYKKRDPVTGEEMYIVYVLPDPAARCPICVHPDDEGTGWRKVNE